MNIDTVIGDSIGSVGGEIFRNTTSEYINGYAFEYRRRCNVDFGLKVKGWEDGEEN
jgi:hypothetical protein